MVARRWIATTMLVGMLLAGPSAAVASSVPDPFPAGGCLWVRDVTPDTVCIWVG